MRPLRHPLRPSSTSPSPNHPSPPLVIKDIPEIDSCNVCELRAQEKSYPLRELNKKCTGCNILRSVMLLENVPVTEKSRVMFQYSNQSASSSALVVIGEGGEGDGDGEGKGLGRGRGVVKCVVELFVGDDAEYPVDGFLYPHLPATNFQLSHLSGDTGSMDAVQWVQTHLSECDRSTTHKSCRPKANTPLPTRVLEIRSPHRVRLFHKTSAINAKYICLSHCWGKKQLITTKRKNFRLHTFHIRWSKLPKTFQDAVNFTYNLGIRYLWIDSLCIIQDCEADWRREGANMANIYHNSYLTITAAKAKDSSGGLFAMSDPSYVSKSFLVRDTAGQECCLHIRDPLDHDLLFRTKEEGQKPLPLMTRGWTLQEMILPPRIVHFLPQELMWECNTLIDCECGVQSKDERSASLNTKLVRPITDLHGLSSEEVAKRWRRVVEEYGRRNLTYEKDIFPALQGLAKYYSGVKKAEYVAGCWSDDLIGDLLWCVPPSEVGREGFEARLVNWRAPTWSWAGVKSAVAFVRTLELADEVNQRTAMAVVQAEVAAVEDSFGQLRPNQAVLKIEGEWLDMKMRWEFASSSSAFEDDALAGKYVPNFFLTPVGATGDEATTGGRDTLVEIPAVGTEYMITPDYAFWIQPGMVQKTRVRVVRLEQRLAWIYCLLLICGDEEEGTYKRIGLLQYGMWGSLHRLFRSVSEGVVVVI